LELNLQRHVHRAVLGKLAKIQQHLRIWRLLERLNSVRHRPHGGAFRLLCHELAVNPQANRVIDRHVHSISRMDRAERLWLLGGGFWYRPAPLRPRLDLLPRTRCNDFRVPTYTHIANISTAIQTADAQTILNAASARMLRVSFGVM
jgi:hypothetical protein